MQARVIDIDLGGPGQVVLPVVGYNSLVLADGARNMDNWREVTKDLELRYLLASHCLL